MMLEGFVVLALICFAGGFILHIQFVRDELQNQRDFMNGVLNEVKVISQTALIHTKSKSVDEAVVAQAYLEGEQVKLDDAEGILAKEVEPPKKLKGFRGSDNKLYTFASPPPSSVLSKIPKERLIYEPND